MYYVTNIMIFDHKLSDKIINSKGEVDFNILIPMPAHSDTFWAEGSMGPVEIAKYGKNNWYDWSIDHWSTKFNASNSVVDLTGSTCIANFDTPDDYPHIWMSALAEYGDFYALYADETVGSNCGILKAEEGRLYSKDDSILTPAEAMALSFYVKGYDSFGAVDYCEGMGVHFPFKIDGNSDTYELTLKRILPPAFKFSEGVE